MTLPPIINILVVISSSITTKVIDIYILFIHIITHIITFSYHHLHTSLPSSPSFFIFVIITFITHIIIITFITYIIITIHIITLTTL